MNTAICTWDDCDQTAIYCAGHASEYFQPELDKAVAELAATKEALRVAGEERDELREDVALLQDQLDGASPFIKGLRSELAYLRSNTAALEAQIASTKQALAAIKSQDTHRTSAQDR